MRPHPEDHPQVHAQGTDVRPGLALDVEHAHVALVVKLEQLGLVDRPDAQLALHGRDERRALEEGARQLLHRREEHLLRLDGVVEADHDHVLLTGVLLRLDQARGALHADDQAPRDLGVEGAGVARLLDAEDALDPGDDLVRGRVGRLVEVDDAGLDVVRDRALQGRASRRDGCVVARALVELVVVL